MGTKAKERTEIECIQELTAKLDHTRDLVIGELTEKAKSRDFYMRKLHVEAKQNKLKIERQEKQILELTEELGRRELEIDRLRGLVTELGGDWV